MNNWIKAVLATALLILSACNLVDPAPTVTLSSNAVDDTASIGSEVILSAEVSADATRVEFLEEGVVLFEDTRQPFTTTVKFPDAGARTFTAKAFDANSSTSSSPLTITAKNPEPAFALTLEVDNLEPKRSQTVNLSVTSTNEFPQGSNVEFLANGSSIGSDDAAPFALGKVFDTLGPVTLVAVLKDSSNAELARAERQIVVSDDGGIAFKDVLVKLKSIRGVSPLNDAFELDNDFEISGQISVRILRSDGEVVEGGNGILFDNQGGNQSVVITDQSTVLTDILERNLQPKPGDQIELTFELKEEDPNGLTGGFFKREFNLLPDGTGTVAKVEFVNGTRTIGMKAVTGEMIQVEFEFVIP
jgi:hypothetical protein